MALYANDGSINVTVVSGVTYTGIQAADGSLNVITAPGGSYVGAYHACGAAYVTVSPGTFVPIRAPDGSLYVTTTSTLNTGQRVTVVSGSLSGSAMYYYYLGF